MKCSYIDLYDTTFIRNLIMDQGSGVTTLRDYFMVLVLSNSKMANYLS